jgi:sugar/nucleoside kinase (ribokinase family)
MSEAAGRERTVLVVGSVALDDIETPHEKREMVLGGSASYSALAAAAFAPVRMVGVVGEDFPDSYRDLYLERGLDLEGLQVVPGLTFRWGGLYAENMNQRQTLFTELNVFEHFNPELPEAYRNSTHILLANIHPALQGHVLDQAEDPCFVACDTMDLWISIARDDLNLLLPRVDLLSLNDTEAVQLTGRTNLLDAGREILSMGPRYVVIKKGEHGAMLLSEAGLFLTPAYPVSLVSDPTGAGDTFLGGLLGSIAQSGDGNGDEPSVRRALLDATVMASFAVEDFSPFGIGRLPGDSFAARRDEFRSMLRVD